jgi:four helix bundle protein
MSISSFRDLKVWQISMDLAEKIYLLTQKFPKRETYGIISQVQRACISVPSNIAEGHARDSTKEFLHFISIALGSLAELETQLLLASRFTYINKSDLESVLSKVDEIGRMLRGLQKSLKTKLSLNKS